MLYTGHVLIDADGRFVSLDAGFCAILRVPPDAIVGRTVMDVTAPADRVECAAAIETLRRTHIPFVIVKRFMRDDGALVWVRNTVSIMASDTADGEPGLIMATIEMIEDATQARSPATLLENARAIVGIRKARATVCDRTLFSEPAWDAILEIYIAEAEGRTVDVETLAARLGHTGSVTGRWINALLQYGVLEIELRNPVADAAKAYRLTAATHRKLETFLARIGTHDTLHWYEAAA